MKYKSRLLLRAEGGGAADSVWGAVSEYTSSTVPKKLTAFWLRCLGSVTLDRLSFL